MFDLLPLFIYVITITTAADLHNIQQSTINLTSNNLLPAQQSGVITIAEVLVLVDEEQQKCNNHLRTEKEYRFYTTQATINQHRLQCITKQSTK